MSSEPAILAAVLVPLLGAVLIVLIGRTPNLREMVTLITSSITFLIVLTLFNDVAGGGRPSVTVLEMLPGLGITFTLEPLGMLFAVIASGLWIITSIYAIGYMRGHHEVNQTRFYTCS